MSKLITVFGATGNQGGSVIRHILADATLSKTFKIRGITRDVTKPAAQALAKQGVETVKADLSSKASLTDAIRGSHTVFLVTNYWESASYDIEVTQGKNVVDIAKEEGVQHLIFSSLLSVKKATNGRLSHVPHFDGKADIEEYIKQSGVPGTFFLPGYFMSNYDSMIQKNEDGSFGLAYPVGKDAKFPLVNIADTGKWVNAIIKNRDTLLGKHVYAAADYYTPTRILAELEEVTGAKTTYTQVPGDVYKSFLPEFMAEEMLENHLFIEEPGYYNGAGLEESLAILEEKPESWKEYAARTFGKK
ncbi:putative NmrA family transcriptional regulator [Dendryphion nanum]|uniref:NmrA family transcriptional regulator n=1 Tax=Dendryphion nanum TaxID=256645 RepID=A0A9P9ICT3_9PLEO|nr:putative NmrA family transcriptional regulator [Dendryphion nanum]